MTADEIEDPHKLAISLTLNGELMQNSNTSQPDLRRAAADRVPFQRDDAGARATSFPPGTPAGVGFARKPPRCLRPGDEVADRSGGHRTPGQSGGGGSTRLPAKIKEVCARSSVG